MRPVTSRIRSQVRHLAFASTVSLSLVGCAPPEETSPAAGETNSESAEVFVDTNRTLVTRPSDLPSGTAALTVGGKITVNVWHCQTSSPQAHPRLGCSVGSDHVLVGGGGWAEFNGGGAFLTGSYPVDANLTTWQAESKDHGVSDPHILHTYAIGLKLTGVSRPTLMANMKLTSNTGESAAYADGWAEMPATHLLISGGAKVNWSGAGNLLTSMGPNVGFCTTDPCDGQRWLAGSKEHGWSSPATITAFAIGIKPTIAGFGNLKVVRHWLAVLGVSAGVGTFSGSVPTSTGAVVSVGGGVSWEPNDAGRLLFRMAPGAGDNEFILQDRDHLVASASRVLVAQITQLAMK